MRENTKLRSLVAEYREHLRLQGKNEVGIQSLMRYVEYAEEHTIDFLYLKIKDADAFHSWLTTRKTTKGTSFSVNYIQGIIANTSSFYAFLKQKKLIYANPFTGINRIRKPKTLPRNILTEEEMSALLAHFRNFNQGKDLSERMILYKTHVAAELMYSTGARINEIARLKLTDIDLYRGVITIDDTKSNQKREGILNSYAEKALRIYLDTRELIIAGRGKFRKDQDVLFGSPSGVRMWLNKTLQRTSKHLGLGSFTSHAIRHTVGYHLLRGGTDIRYIQEILGHKKLYSTQIYTKVDKEDLKQVIDRYHPRSGSKE